MFIHHLANKKISTSTDYLKLLAISLPPIDLTQPFFAIKLQILWKHFMKTF